MKIASIVLVVLVAVSDLAVGGDGDKAMNFKVTTKRVNDRVEVRGEKDRTVFSIHSPFGISQAVIERKDERWSQAVVLRLHLKGLESFRVSNGEMKLDAAVTIREGKPIVRLWKDGKENTPLDEKSPLWMDIRILTSAGKPATELPLKNGYFEVTLPRAFLQGNPKSIALNWIDFYRN